MKADQDFSVQIEAAVSSYGSNPRRLRRLTRQLRHPDTRPLCRKCAKQLLKREPESIEAIASLSRLDTTVVQKAFSLASAKGVAAMSWKAGLSAEPAHQMQLRLAKVPPDEAIGPVDGGYALSDTDLDWQIEFLGG